MKVAIYDKDIESAANLAMLVQQMIKGSTVEYVEHINDPKLSECSVVVADPNPDLTSEWLFNFRRINGQIPLVLISENSDLLRGSLQDKCYAIYKPYNVRELLEIIIIAGSGKKLAGFEGSKRSWQ